MRDLSQVHPSCKEFVEVVRELLERRRDELRHGARTPTFWRGVNGDEGRTFSATQFRDSVYSSFPSVLRGQVKSPPPRDTVSLIATYLECNISERNRLLVAAGYALVPVYLTGAELDTVLSECARVLRYVPAPSIVVTRDWDIHIINDRMLRFMRITRAQWDQELTACHNILDLLCNDASPAYTQLMHNPHSWRGTIERLILGYKVDNVFCEFESWHLERVARWRNLPGPAGPMLARMWDDIKIDRWQPAAAVGADFTFYTMSLKQVSGEVVRLRPMFTIVGDYRYPRIISLLPADEASERVLQQ
jgi:hypothetical protein